MTLGATVPHERLSPDALRRVVEEFVTREGTEYGAVDVTLDAKVKAVIRQIERGDVVILHDAESETVNIVPKRHGGSHG